ncbi:MAG: glycoside hydrolase family 3 N-terminal domain-containing protein [Dehalococcoidia bacterium]
MHERGRHHRHAWLRAGLLVAAIAGAAWAGAGALAPAAAQEPDPALLDRVLASLTIEERVGQLVMVNFVGDDVSAESDIAGLVRDFKAGAVLVTASNGNVVNRGDTAGQLATLTNSLQQRAFESSRRTDPGGEYFLPLLIATDNEGDLFPFTNITNGYTSIPNNMTIGATWSKAHAQATGAIVGRELSAAGVNLLLGPVVDVLDNPRSGGAGDIGIRSFGGNAAWAGALGRAYVRGVHEGSGGRMLTVAKHFPGHGGSDRSTDGEVPTVTKSLAQLRALELAPFAEAARTDGADPLGVTDAMMVSHIRYRNFVPGSAEPFTRPISLDAPAFEALMALPEFSSWREDHLVMSDSLGVPAIKKWYAQQGEAQFPNRTVVREALLAGSDLLPVVEFYVDPAKPGWHDNQLPLIQDSILYMREQYLADAAFRRRVDEAVRHVIAAKMRLYPKLQLDEVTVDAAQASEAAGGGEEAMTQLAEDALTLIHPQSVGELRARLPRGPVTPDKVLIIECWEDCYPYRVMPKARLQDALLRLYGPQGSARLQAGDVSTISFGELDAWLAAPADPANATTDARLRDATWIIMALTEYSPVSRPASGAVKRLLDTSLIDVRNKNLVAISYNVPYHLDSTEISKLSAYFVVYSKTQASIDAGFRALFGDLTPGGHSPVDVQGIFYRVEDVVQPDPGQTIAVSLFGQDASAIPAGATVNIVAGPIADRNGNPVPDGTTVTFALTRAGGAAATSAGDTIDGIAGASIRSSGAGDYAATALVAGITSSPFAIVVEGAAPEPTPGATASEGDDGGSNVVLIVALAVGIPAGVALLGGAVAGAPALRRRSRRSVGERVLAADVSPAPLAEPAEASVPPKLRIDAETRRVYVNGSEARPPLSGEQFRLLLYLYERAGRVVGREELVQHVWPEAHAEGVSEEALDALVRRVRERIVQAGGERSYIVTLRGQGFRLEI